MRKVVPAILFCLGAMFIFNTQSKAQSLLNYWSFNVDSTTVLTETSSMVSGGSLSYTGAYFDTVQPGTILNGVGADGISLNSASAALRLRNPVGSGSFTLTLPTTGYKNIVLKYAVERTKQGSQTNTVTYTIDGSTWINTAIAANATYSVDSTDSITNAFQLETFDFTSDVSVNNNPNFKVQINFSNGNTNPTGNNRFDNITVYGVSTTGITQIASVSEKYTLYPNPVINALDIDAVSGGNESVVITNASGQIVYKGTQTGKHFSINTTSFPSGNYFISINESDDSKVISMKFIKQ